MDLYTILRPLFMRPAPTNVKKTLRVTKFFNIYHMNTNASLSFYLRQTNAYRRAIIPYILSSPH